jgi:hypothetical protein
LKASHKDLLTVTIIGTYYPWNACDVGRVSQSA